MGGGWGVGGNYNIYFTFDSCFWAGSFGVVGGGFGEAITGQMPS